MSRAESARARRRTRAVESHKSAADCIGTIEPGVSLFAITRGQFSMIDAIQHVINQVGECDVSCWTWCIADYEVEAFEYFFVEKRIQSARLMIDRSAEQRNLELINRWRELFGESAVRVCMNHAKIATIQSAKYKVLCRGSMNLNFNPRFEQFDLTEGGEDFDLVRRIELELPVLPRSSSRRDAAIATQLEVAWDADDLKPFGDGLKVWNK